MGEEGGRDLIVISPDDSGGEWGQNGREEEGEALFDEFGRCDSSGGEGRPNRRGSNQSRPSPRGFGQKVRRRWGRKEEEDRGGGQGFCLLFYGEAFNQHPRAPLFLN